MELALESLTYNVQDGNRQCPLIQVPALHVPSGQSVALSGSSGAGKTTFLNLLCGLLRPTQGRVFWNGEDICTLPEATRDAWRRKHVGMIFQDFRLLPGLSVLDNVLLPATFGHVCIPEAVKARALSLVARLGLGAKHQLGRRASLLSRGEMQRVALARALLFAPAIILADEPTASLDAANAATVANLLLESAAELHCTLLVVSHDPALAKRMQRHCIMEHGTISEAS